MNRYDLTLYAMVYDVYLSGVRLLAQPMLIDSFLAGVSSGEWCLHLLTSAFSTI